MGIWEKSHIPNSLGFIMEYSKNLFDLFKTLHQYTSIESDKSLIEEEIKNFIFNEVKCNNYRSRYTIEKVNSLIKSSIQINSDMVFQIHNIILSKFAYKYINDFIDNTIVDAIERQYTFLESDNIYAEYEYLYGIFINKSLDGIDSLNDRLVISLFDFEDGKVVDNIKFRSIFNNTYIMNRFFTDEFMFKYFSGCITFLSFTPKPIECNFSFLHKPHLRKSHLPKSYLVYKIFSLRDISDKTSYVNMYRDDLSKSNYTLAVTV